MSRANRVKRAVKKSADKPFQRAEGRTENQRAYIQDILDNDYTICIGPAGTGKTHLAAGLAAESLVNREVRKIILTRPCVAAEDLGYLPGDREEKMHPYLIPLFEELDYFLDVESLIKSKHVFIEPIAFLRGRTIKDAFIVVDEAQNCTFSQLKMITTRLGEGSQMVINGDLSQSDLPPGKSGLAEFVNKIQADQHCSYGIITVRQLGKEDIVRHPSVNVILNALEK